MRNNICILFCIKLYLPLFKNTSVYVKKITKSPFLALQCTQKIELICKVEHQFIIARVYLRQGTQLHVNVYQHVQITRSFNKEYIHTIWFSLLSLSKYMETYWLLKYVKYCRKENAGYEKSSLKHIFQALALLPKTHKRHFGCNKTSITRPSLGRKIVLTERWTHYEVEIMTKTVRNTAVCVRVRIRS